jgi:transposase
VLDAEIEEVFLVHPFGELLSTLPGIGPRTGSRILAEIGDGTRFADGDRLASYAGLAPVTRQPGKSINGESQSLRGNHRLTNAMFPAAFRRPHLPRPQALQRHPRHARHPASPTGPASPRVIWPMRPEQP